MSVTYVPVELRQLVVARSEGICEYCLIAEEDTFFGCQIDHIISEKHGGPTAGANLAIACVTCNQAKGSDIASIDWDSGNVTRLFNPRTDNWSEHFQLGEELRFEARSSIGKVTINLLGLNHPDRLLERQALLDRYPNAAAKKRMGRN